MRKRPEVCRRCGAKATRRRVISYAGNCPLCAQILVTENVLSMVDKRGPRYERWRAGMANAASRAARQLGEGVESTG